MSGGKRKLKTNVIKRERKGEEDGGGTRILVSTAAVDESFSVSSPLSRLGYGELQSQFRKIIIASFFFLPVQFYRISHSLSFTCCCPVQRALSGAISVVIHKNLHREEARFAIQCMAHRSLSMHIFSAEISSSRTHDEIDDEGYGVRERAESAATAENHRKS